MNVFELRQRLVDDYAAYTRSFIKIADEDICNRVDQELAKGAFWPEPLLQLNPTFQKGGSIDDLVKASVLLPECGKIFRLGKTDNDHTGQPLFLHDHQRRAILKAAEKKSYVLTSGTGSGKSLAYIVPIVDHILRRGSGKGIQAIVVYPMNALANSQTEEVRKFLEKGFPEGKPPVRFARYTGQEKSDERERMRANPPDVLLTNYMMLELMLTRNEDRQLVRAAQGLSFLVIDELHTYRGRQGADVALLIRRSRLAFGGHDFVCVGTSATMASAGTVEMQKNQVAHVARLFFGTAFTADQVIEERLERSTPEIEFRDARAVAQLSQAIDPAKAPPSEYESFCTHPLSSWIESTFGVREESDFGPEYLVRQTPRSLIGPGSASEELAKLTTTDPTRCAEVLQRFFLAGADERMRRSASSRFPIFAFRLHQFFTRGDTVWSTIEPKEVRHLEISKKVSKPGESEKLMFPMVFCRQCGTAYYRVNVSSGSHRFLAPRENRREEGDGETKEAYLYVSEDHPWPIGEGPQVLERLPSALKEVGPQGIDRVRSDSRKYIPESVFVDPRGRLASEGYGIAGALIFDNFLFCLNPGCGVAYDKSQRSERLKLATLGVDNRSTATTILAVRALIELQHDPLLTKEAKKLLSFTDNRQDASLQAGHFNDFAQVSLLRSALFKALSSQPSNALRHADLSRYVVDAMALPFDEYAADPNVKGPAVTETENSLRRIIDYFLYRDLKRGWRVTAPNLEDCGMLSFQYEGLEGKDGLLFEEDLWNNGFVVKENHVETKVNVPESFRDLSREKRREVLLTLLDMLRRKLAIKVDVLNPAKQLDLVESTKQRLREDTVWYLDDPKELESAGVAYIGSRPPHDRNAIPVSSLTQFGRYLKRTLAADLPKGKLLGKGEIDEVVEFLFLSLKRYGILEQVRSGEYRGYQINANALVWLPGSGELKPLDRLRTLAAGEMPSEVNRYFVECYKGFVDLNTVLEAREHTAQVAGDDREVREERFRTGELPLLFCSPTMELGVDIAQLNLVNLRNVPPTPANYAQRSGRAGRGGQPALVYTYCAGQSPHDQFYYRQPAKMVAGAVAPPRLDLGNRDLVRSHLHAVWMEVAKPDLGKTLATVLDLAPHQDNMPLPVKESLLQELRKPTHRATARAKADQLVDSIHDVLKNCTWFNEQWTKEVFDQVERSFDASCDRWRALYRAAVRQREIHHRIIADQTRPEAERAQSRRLRAQAESQIKLLTEAEGVFEGDFYSYRYFASEGFLPGYNFPRLPISAYVPARRTRRDRDEYISRPRFLAISEFGPRALIYHEGARYRVYKVNLDFGSSDLEATHNLAMLTLKRCPKCGYAHAEQGTNMAEICDRCAAPLDSSTRLENLVQLQNVSLKLAQRITCDEEERQRYGYRLVTSYRFPDVGGKPDRFDAEVRVKNAPVLRMSYGDATDLYRINLGWAQQLPGTAPGFNLDLERGYWSKNQADDSDSDDAAAEGRIQRVVPFVKDTKNALVVQLEQPLSGPEMASLQAALKEAILKHFQLEPRELACEPMPNRHDRRQILFYESAEGGAGVLRQVAADPLILPKLARLALEICHHDPSNLHDLAATSCGKACYECLLDYGNQPDHKDLDRGSIKDFLASLMQSRVIPAGGEGTRAERLAALRKRCDSELERKWLDLVEKHLLRLPSDAQYLISGGHTKPDFFYGEFNAAIYIDGPPHDAPDQAKVDEQITKSLMNLGYAVIRFHHKADWNAIFKAHPDVFGKYTP